MEHKISIKTVNGILSIDEFRTRVIAKADVIGVVLQTEIIGVIISLDQWEEKWCSEEKYTLVDREYSETEALQTLSGLELTRKLFQRNQNDGEKMTAAIRCWTYHKGGLQWYLPSLYELGTIMAYCDKLNEVFDMLGASLFKKGDDGVWSSSEHLFREAWGAYLDTNSLTCESKSCSFKVRAVSAYHPLSTEANITSTPMTIESAISFLQSQGYSGELTKKIRI